MVEALGTDDQDMVDCQTMMNRVNLAYEVLGEEDKRILYDAGGMELVKQGTGDEGGGGGMDPFAALFGGGGRQQNRNRGQEAHVELGVSLEDMYNGNEVEAHIQR